MAGRRRADQRGGAGAGVRRRGRGRGARVPRASREYPANIVILLLLTKT